MSKGVLAEARGITLIELVLVAAIMSTLAAIAIPNITRAQRNARYTRAVGDAKVAVTQAVVYQFDATVYPGTLANLRLYGYASLTDLDPGGNSWVVSDLFADTTLPLADGTEVHVCSEGPTGAAADCSTADLAGSPSGTFDGGVGYSATYGAWVGS